MQSKALSVKAYLAEVSADKSTAVKQLHQTILQNLPDGFEACISYGMIGYVVPHKLYPKGYHCNPEQPLPFISLAAQKNAISLYHMGIYANPQLMNWFVAEYAKHVKTKLDMGKSCIRFKKPEQIPFQLIGELVKKMSVKQWIQIYEATYLK